MDSTFARHPSGSKPRLRALHGASALALVLCTHQAVAQEDHRDIDEIVVSGEDGAGVLNLRKESDVSGRLGLTLLETPGNIELIDSEALLLRGDFGAIEAVTRATGLTSAATPATAIHRSARVGSRGMGR